MTSRPISFSGPMVRAILEDRKTQTRRIIKPHRGDDEFAILDERDKGGARWPYRSCDGGDLDIGDGCEHRLVCKYGEPGDQLWVREAAWISAPHFADDDWRKGDSGCIRDDEGRKRFVSWDADCDEELRDAARSYGVRMRVPRFMPRWASRLTLDITDIRVERLNEISEDDAHAEGFASVAEFCAYWDVLNGKKHPWAESPWVWVITFRRVSE